MQYTIQNLSSGLPVLTASTDGTASVTAMVFAGAGSRYETESERGISHFLEHMFFKGGNRYKNTKEVSMAIDAVGGEFNAFTGKEYAGYYVKVAAEHVNLGCDVLGDMLCNASFPQEEIEKERGVIIEEDRMYQDTPMYRAGWDFEELMFGSAPLGWDTIGTHAVINSVQQADFQKHKDLLYTPDNLVIAFAGNIKDTQALELADTYFGSMSGTKGREFAPLSHYGSEKVYLRTKKTEQSHLVIGVPGVSSQHEHHFAHKLLAVILGGNMSSRMFLNIREAKGMCYYIDTDTDSYLDAGSLSTRAGIDQSRLDEAIKLIINEYDKVVEGGVEQDEVERAKSYLKGSIILSLEDSEELAHFYGKQQLLYPEVRDIDQYIRAIEAVNKEEIDALAASLLTHDNLRLAVIGNTDNKAALEGLLS
ncbi:MAG: insulinase family protein [Candidatus Peregrinibacteria bacterium]|nr:insulinase family protein [Candidatus Peregrinibacteria bacterium]MCB9808023.1 insulinase family protein [Candidatus Peribacteria bacterium]